MNHLQAVIFEKIPSDFNMQTSREMFIGVCLTYNVCTCVFSIYVHIEKLQESLMADEHLLSIELSYLERKKVKERVNFLGSGVLGTQRPQRFPDIQKKFVIAIIFLMRFLENAHSPFNK